jgi:hypothetical protein
MMTFDYLNLKLPESKKTGLHTLTLQMKMDKVLFMLHLYPDFELAGAVGGVGNIHSFLPFHFGKEIYDEMKEDVSERRKNKDLTAMIGLLTDVYELWLEDYDINQFYNMITGKHIVEEDLIKEKEKEIINQKKELIPSEHLTFSNVIRQIDIHLQVEAMTQTPDVPPGIWWVVAYEQVKLKGKLRPFVLLARLNDKGRICYLQGAWPLSHLNDKYLSRLLSIPYRIKKDEPFIFLKIEGYPTEVDGQHEYTRYTNVQLIDSPVEKEKL